MHLHHSMWDEDLRRTRPSSRDPVIGMSHYCLFNMLKIPLFSMSSSHDPVIGMFHCLFIMLKIPLFSMSSSHDPVIGMFHCLFILLKIPLFSMSSSHNPVNGMFPLPFHGFKNPTVLHVIRLVFVLTFICRRFDGLFGRWLVFCANVYSLLSISLIGERLFQQAIAQLIGDPRYLRF